jgi:nucleotide-binding universal stress UspA family protein
MKYDRILFPIEFSDDCRAITNQVERLADQFNSRVTLLHVCHTPAACFGATEAYFTYVDTWTSFIDDSKQHLDKFQINLPRERVDRVLLQEGDLGPEIVKWADANETDLIVMGTHGCGTIRGLLLGSIAAKVLSDVTCPVWICPSSHIRDKKRTDSRTVICAVEFTEEATALLHFANDWSQRSGANVIVVHSVPEAETRPNKYFDTELHDFLVSQAREHLTHLQADAGTNFPFELSTGGITSAIAEAVREQDADLVIIGRGKCQDFLGRLRTHAYDIIRGVPCPVLSYSCRQENEIKALVNALGQKATMG